MDGSVQAKWADFGQVEVSRPDYKLLTFYNSLLSSNTGKPLSELKLMRSPVSSTAFADLKQPVMVRHYDGAMDVYDASELYSRTDLMANTRQFIPYIQRASEIHLNASVYARLGETPVTAQLQQLRCTLTQKSLPELAKPLFIFWNGEVFLYDLANEKAPSAITIFFDKEMIEMFRPKPGIAVR